MSDRNGAMNVEPAWNRCDVCGRFIAFDDFGNGAVRQELTPDSHRSRETWETLCIQHAREEKQT